MTNQPWEEIEHTADVALRVRGATLAEIFTNTADGMLSLAVEHPPTGMQQPVEVTLEAPDHETLLVDWLSELVYLMEEETFVVSGVESLVIEGNTLHAKVTGGTGGVLQRHIKAVTYHDLSIEKTESDYQVTIVFDV